jgi:hypothetical protein
MGFPSAFLLKRTRKNLLFQWPVLPDHPWPVRTRSLTICHDILYLSIVQETFPIGYRDEKSLVYSKRLFPSANAMRKVLSIFRASSRH